LSEFFTVVSCVCLAFGQRGAKENGAKLDENASRGQRPFSTKLDWFSLEWFIDGFAGWIGLASQ
jgi:hypothetical protein